MDFLNIKSFKMFIKKPVLLLYAQDGMNLLEEQSLEASSNGCAVIIKQ